MNECIKKNAAMGDMPPREAVAKILDAMIGQRKKTTIAARPYYDGLYRQPELHGAYCIDAAGCYPDAKTGDSVYISSDIVADCTALGKISVNDNSTVWLNGKKLLGICGGKICFGTGEQCGKHFVCETEFVQGKNRLVILKTKSDDDFTLEVKCSFVLYQGRWSEDYILCLGARLPFREEMEGFAVTGLIPSGAAQDLQMAENYRFPEIQSYGGDFDFNKLYPEAQRGAAAYAFSRARCDTELKLSAASDCEIFVNRKKSALKAGNICRIELKKDDEVLIKSVRGDDWGFAATADEEMAVAEVEGDERWICIGAFLPGADNITPESGVQLVTPYKSGDETVFWRLNADRLWIRLYNDSKFFGQWFYAVMVGLFGIRESAQLLENEETLEYYIDSVGIMADYYDYAQYDFKRFGSTHVISRSVKLDTWDDIGTVGMCLCEMYKIRPDEKLLRLIKLMASKISSIPAFDDGTFYRVKTMWADDFYMSGSFLTRLYSITKDKKYSDMLLCQLRGYKERLWMEDEKLFSHIFFPDSGEPSRVPWGRGNGWVAVTLTEILLHCDDEQLLAEARELLAAYAKGIAKNQDSCGMWHQVLNRPDSYIETSCSAMFVLALARGINNGWLDEGYSEVVKNAWNAILNNAVDKEGNVYGVCLGSGCHREAEYYFNIPTHINDDHGTGIILAAGCEAGRLAESTRRKER